MDLLIFSAPMPKYPRTKLSYTNNLRVIGPQFDQNPLKIKG
jgi:hypothetical protein